MTPDSGPQQETTKGASSPTGPDLTKPVAHANMYPGGAAKITSEPQTEILTRSSVAAQLNREREFSERLIETSLEGIFAFDTDCRYTVWNPAMERMMECTKAQVLGRVAFDVFPFLRETGEDKLFREALAGNAVAVSARPYPLGEGGRSGFFEGHYAPVWDVEGKIIGGIALIHDITERKRAEESVRSLTARLFSLQDEERRRLARELHDNTAQTLSALALNLALLKQYAGFAERSEASRALEESLALTEQASNEIRTFSHLLHPPLLDDIGLSEALRWYVDGFARRSGIQVELEIEPDFGAIPRELENTLFRVVQESLMNVLRHSRSWTAGIRLVRTPDQVVMHVWDHGKGLPADVLEDAEGSEAALGVGIRGMRERVKQLGGTLELRPAEPGTVVEVVVPL
jgi:PAS domain S-box-containing protein